MPDKPEPMRIFQGLAGSPAIAILSVRKDPSTGDFRTRTEFLDGPTENSVVAACNKRVAELEADPKTVRIIIAPISSERRREDREIMGRIVIPFKRVNGHNHG